MLSHQWLGPQRNAVRLVLAHGFSQNSRCWGSFGTLCANFYDVLAVDAPGHGWSGLDESTPTDAGRAIVDAGGRGHYVGYSMGGRLLLHAALTDRARDMRSLILIGATPGIESPTERAERRVEDERRAARIMEIGSPAFITEWLEQPMFAHLTDEQTAKFQRFENSPEGMAKSLRYRGTGVQQPLWGHLAALQMPVLIIAGTNDAKYTEIGQRMVAAIGSNARFVNVEGGHAVHLENPTVTAAVIESWGKQLN